MRAAVNRADAGVTINAGPHLIFCTAQQLIGQMGVGEQLAAHCNEIQLARTDGLVRRLRLDPARSDHRNADRAAHLCRGGQVEAFYVRGVRFRMERALAGFVIGGDGDGVGPGGFQHAGSGLAVLDRDAVLADLARVQLDPYRIVSPHFGADRRQYFQQQPQAVFQRAAILVGALVGIGRDEAGEQIAMPGVDLQPIEPGGLGPACASAELGDDQIDVGLLQHLDFRRLHARHPGQLFHQEMFGEVALGGGGQAGRPERVTIACMRVTRDQPAVVQLHRDFRAVGMDPVGQRLEAGNELVIRNRGLLPRHLADRPGHPSHARNDQARAAARLLLVIGNQLFANGAIIFRQADAHCRHGDAVLQLQRADLAGGEQVGIAVRGHCRASMVMSESARQASSASAQACIAVSVGRASMSLAKASMPMGHVVPVADKACMKPSQGMTPAPGRRRLVMPAVRSASGPALASDSWTEKIRSPGIRDN